MKKRTTVSLMALAIYAATSAQNPIVPTGWSMADPSAHQWKDGKIYVYGSRDMDKRYYCSAHYDVLSSDDLLIWTLHKGTFSSVAPNDGIPYSDKVLFAPDCIEKDGRYYLFYCQEGGGNDEGTAVADSPTGPFKDGRIVEGVSQIDPSVFIDDDGQAYLTWGQYECKIAKLKPGMREIDKESIRTVITEKEHHFHEGSQLIKRNGIYYLVYADISRRGMPTCLGYAISSSPFGPYKYGGVIVDNFGCDPAVWNNHGSLAEVNGQWYVFYHRSTEASRMMRKTCVELVSFNADGSIDEVEMTTQGAAKGLDAFLTMDAERACYLTGHVRVHRDETGNEMLDEIRHEDSAAYKYLNFGKRPEKLTITLRPMKGGTIQVFANNLCRPLLCQFRVPASDGKQPIKLTQPLSHPLEEGTYPIYFRFLGNTENDNLFSLESFVFE